MATIIEGALWTLTEKAANALVEEGILTKCDNEHSFILDVDKPIYHYSINKPDYVGSSNLHSYIIEAEKKVDNKHIPKPRDGTTATCQEDGQLWPCTEARK